MTSVEWVQDDNKRKTEDDKIDLLLQRRLWKANENLRSVLICFPFTCNPGFGPFPILGKRQFTRAIDLSLPLPCFVFETRRAKSWLACSSKKPGFDLLISTRLLS